MPMDYRGHFAGTFETHLDLLAETIQQQKIWARDFKHLWIGIASYQLYDEEREPLAQLRGLLARKASPPDLQPAFEKAGRLKTFAPELHAAIAAELRTPGHADDLAKRLEAFLANPPAGYYPPEKLTATLERVRAQGVEGVVVFSTAGLTSAKLWDTLAAFFGK